MHPRVAAYQGGPEQIVDCRNDQETPDGKPGAGDVAAGRQQVDDRRNEDQTGSDTRYHRGDCHYRAPERRTW